MGGEGTAKRESARKEKELNHVTKPCKLKNRQISEQRGDGGKR